MPLLIKTPRNRDVERQIGPYRQAINVLSRKETAVQRQLRRGGLAGYEPHTQAALLTACQLTPNRITFYDVGAHIGLYSALIGTVFAGVHARGFAFEPTPRTSAICHEVQQHNQLDYHVVQSAVSSTSGTATLHLSDRGESSNSLNPGFRQASEALTVEMTTLDQFAEQRRLLPTLIKIDVETHEAAVLEGALAVIEDARPWIVCEMLAKSDRDAVARVLTRVEQLGYSLYPITAEPPWRPCAAVDHRHLLRGSARDWLLAPRRLDTHFHLALLLWLQAIQECAEHTNVLIDPGTPLPLDWNRPYAS